MIITGGKYWAATGNSPQAETSANPAAYRTALVLTNTRLVRDRIAGRRDLSSPAREGNPIWSRLSRCPSDQRSASLYPGSKREFQRSFPYGKHVTPVWAIYRAGASGKLKFRRIGFCRR